MKRAHRYAKLLVAAGFFIAVESALAQTATGCPAGEAMQSSDPSGRRVICVRIPDVDALQAQIKSEADGRIGMDATLLQAIADEAKARSNADDALRASINEKDIVGRYAFSGPLVCLISNNGFNDDLTPRIAGPGLPNPFQTQVQQFTSIARGVRTFNPDGTGITEVSNQGVALPPIIYPVPPASPFVGFGGPNFLPGGVATEAAQTAPFTWHIADGKVFIAEGVAKGTITKGGTRQGWSVENFNLPASVGLLGKDLKTLTLIQEDLQVETQLSTPPGGVPLAVYRVCTRQRVLTRL